jgi:hypothetical protein
MNEIQIGDIVYLDEEFCWDTDCWIQLLNAHDCFHDWIEVEPKIVRSWLRRTRWIAYKVNHQFVWARCDMLLDRPCQNFFHWEVVPSGERIIPNDPSRYKRTLFEVSA